MTSSAAVETSEAEALALRMRKHFGHKVEVEVSDGVTRVRIPAGEFELEPRDGELAVRATAPDEAGLARVQEVVASHLGRFARGERIRVTWSHALEERAAAWIEGHRNARHLARTRDYVVELRPDAGVALRLAALTHDMERNVPGGVPLDAQIEAFDDADAVRAHSERAAEIVRAWLHEQGAEAALADRVAELVRLHEFGGTEEADVLQAADSLSFLETNPAARWVREGRANVELALRKLAWMRDRIRVPEARALADAHYEPAAAEVERQTVELSGGRR